jgi:hypothetical protein
VALVGANVDGQISVGKDNTVVQLMSITADVLAELLECKHKHMAQWLSSNVSNFSSDQLRFVGIATPPCYDISVANNNRSECYGLDTMTTAFQLLHHCVEHGLLHTYTLEMVCCGQRNLLVTWARTGGRRGVLCWDYLYVASFFGPTHRHRILFKPISAKYNTPVRLHSSSVLDIQVGNALGVKLTDTRYGLKRTTWAALNGATKGMATKGFTVTGSAPRLYHVDNNGVISMDNVSGPTYRKVTVDEHFALMGFPPTIRSSWSWAPNISNTDKYKSIGSGVALHMGVAVASSMVAHVTGRANETAALINTINEDFKQNTTLMEDF